MAAHRAAGGALLRLLSVNDVYLLDNLPRLGTAFAAKEREAADMGADLTHGAKTLRLLAGDFLSPNVLSPIDSGFSFMKCFNAVGVTHLCFGNHEANLKLAQLSERLRECRGKLLNSNVPSFDEPRLPAWDVVAVGERRVGLIGLLSDEPSVFKHGKFKGFPIEDSVAAARGLEAMLRQAHGCDAVVALTHQSMARDRQLAEATGLDAVVGGHEHSPFEETVAGTKIVKTGMNAEAFGCLDLYMGDCGAVQVAYSREEVAAYEADPKLQGIVVGCLDLVKQITDEILIRAPHALSAKGTRFRQTDLGGLLGTYVKAEVCSEVGMINGATIKARADFANGAVSYADLLTVLPFPTKMVVVEMPGHVLQAAVRHSRRALPWDAEKRGFLQLDDGVEVANSTASGPYGAEAAAAAASAGEPDTITRVNGEPFEPERIYSVALPRNLLKGFCEITPLVDFAKAHPEALPGADTFIPALELVVRHCAKLLWVELGEFDDIDENKDGQLSRAEVERRMRLVFGRGPSDAVLTELIDALDLNNNGFITREEFARLKHKI